MDPDFFLQVEAVDRRGGGLEGEVRKGVGVGLIEGENFGQCLVNIHFITNVQVAYNCFSIFFFIFCLVLLHFFFYVLNLMIYLIVK